MKYFLTLLSIIAFSVAVYAQSEPTKMVVTLKDGSVTTYQISDIDSLSFESEAQPKAKAYEVVLPTDFTTGNVQKVMANGKQVAEVCKEYIRSWKDGKNVIDGVLVVAYPMAANGKADLTKGVAANGAKIVWDLENDSIASYTAGEGTIEKLYVSENGEFVNEDAAEDIVTTTFEAYELNDKRGVLDNQTYKIVKIGTQYWMASNLKASTFRDGTAIPKIASTDVSVWNANTSGAYHVYTDDMDYCWSDYGAMYNGYAVLSDKGLAPEGWEVSTIAQWEALKKYLRTGQSGKVKSTATTWKNPGKNTTGMNVIPGGYFNGATGDAGDGTSVYFWTSDKTIDSLFKTDAIKAVYIVNSISTTGVHGYTFGHYVRCVRK